MNKALSFLLILFLAQITQAQRINPKKLNDEITQLNNEKKYNTSIIKLENIINGKEYTSYDKYNAYLQKSFTYKRLYNYSEALDNLNQALAIGIKSPKATEVESRILVEKLFITFDLQKHTEVDQYLAQIKPENIKLIDEKTQSFFISLLAVLDMRKNDYKNADLKLDQAIQLLEKVSPMDLPNIYQKKITLYHFLSQPKLALESYEKGMYYAEKYKMDLYKISMLESLTKYYVDSEDYKNALLTQNKVNNARTQYNHVNQTGKLNILEKELLQKRKNIEIDYEKKISYVLIFLSMILIAFVFVLVKFHLANKQKNILMQRENSRMRMDLESLTKEFDEKGNEKLYLQDYHLTQRQIDIINLIKEGKTNKEIGTILFISENTVKYHLKVIYNILGIENRWGLKK
ncbi:helix-turn-helix transcriptional regulator [Kaistella sp.]|uniref:helix-turn-helix transcriptional regulator n=1 Tax=Kaistella sp. TaxID=2782235 RepID=UPI003C4F16AC